MPEKLNEMVQTELDRLPTMPIIELRALWHVKFKSEPPKAFGPDLLKRSIAHKIQEVAYGGLDVATSRLLDQLMAQHAKTPGKIILPRRIQPGVVLVRDFKGANHRVTVLTDGFAYQGKTYSSLSEIARLITGTHWNGPRFFGLRAKEEPSNERTQKVLRCAIYTRKSTDHGLELEFNSLDAQREACEAYIKSQAAEGWQPLPYRYDDPAYSGGNMDRPALQKMLKDIARRQIDIVVVYKIDRLTRSLADFAKLVDIFEAKSVSFVAITQQFNSTTSMGRLTLNVLLSFAQFERELASERVRDKIAASRKKGKWTGGSVPLGYDVKDKKLVVSAAEVKTVRMIFSRYLALKSFQKLVDELNEEGVLTKRRQVTSKTVGGIPLPMAPSPIFLKNRTYLGQTHYKDQWFAGEHEAIIPQGIFDQVQQLLKTNSIGRTGRRHENGALLTGLLFDDRGNRMSPSFTTKHGARYPFYVSTALLRGRKSHAGSIARIAARELETKVLSAVHDHVDIGNEAYTRRELLERFIERVTAKAENVMISFKDQSPPIYLPWIVTKKSAAARIENELDEIKYDPQLVHSLVRSHIWLKWLRDGTYETIEGLAQNIKLHPKVIRHRIRLAFLAPQIVRSILNGSYGGSVAVTDVCNSASLNWTQQVRDVNVG